MLGLILLFFIGKWHYTLAEEFNKNKWLFAILGIVVYYGGIMIGAFILGLLSVLFDFEEVLELPEIVLGLIALPIGLLATWAFRVISLV